MASNQKNIDMKKLLLAAFVLSAAFFAGCNGGNDPKSVLMKFYDAMEKKDIAAARKLCTAESKQMLDLMEMGAKMAEGKDKKDEKYDKSKLEFGEPKIEGDKATIAVKEKGNGEVTNFTLKKEGGSWKVAFDKASMMNMSPDKPETDMPKMDADSLNSELEKLKDMNIPDSIK